MKRFDFEKFCIKFWFLPKQVMFVQIRSNFSNGMDGLLCCSWHGVEEFYLATLKTEKEKNDLWHSDLVTYLLLQILMPNFYPQYQNQLLQLLFRCFNFLNRWITIRKRNLVNSFIDHKYNFDSIFSGLLDWVSFWGIGVEDNICCGDGLVSSVFFVTGTTLSRLATKSSKLFILVMSTFLSVVDATVSSFRFCVFFGKRI